MSLIVKSLDFWSSSSMFRKQDTNGGLVANCSAASSGGGIICGIGATFFCCNKCSSENLSSGTCSTQCSAETSFNGVELECKNSGAHCNNRKCSYFYFSWQTKAVSVLVLSRDGCVMLRCFGRDADMFRGGVYYKIVIYHLKNNILLIPAAPKWSWNNKTLHFCVVIQQLIFWVLSMFILFFLLLVSHCCCSASILYKT